VQKRILKADIAALEKRLAAAKKESERIAAAKSAIRASGEKLSKDLLLQREAALRKLKAAGKQRKPCIAGAPLDIHTRRYV
jgi:hypothetical protein